jgi:hypothetical protein
MSHPLDKVSIRFELSETVTPSSILYCLVRCWAATKHVVVDDGSLRETAFKGDGTVAMSFYKALEELVTKDEQLFSAMQCFSKAKHFRRIAKSIDHLINGGIELRASIERE